MNYKNTVRLTEEQKECDLIDIYSDHYGRVRVEAHVCAERRTQMRRERQIAELEDKLEYLRGL